MASDLARSIVQLAARPDATLYLVADLPQPLPAFKVEVLGARLRLTALTSLEPPSDTAVVARCRDAGFGYVRRLAPGADAIGASESCNGGGGGDGGGGGGGSGAARAPLVLEVRRSLAGAAELAQALREDFVDGGSPDSYSFVRASEEGLDLMLVLPSAVRFDAGHLALSRSACPDPHVVVLPAPGLDAAAAARSRAAHAKRAAAARAALVIWSRDVEGCGYLPHNMAGEEQVAWKRAAKASLGDKVEAALRAFAKLMALWA